MRSAPSALYRAAMHDVRIVTVTLNPAVDRVIEAPSFRVGAFVNGRVLARYPTGRGMTLSRVLATLGVRSVATGYVGQNELSMFEDHLELVARGRVVCQFLVVHARTRDNITVVDPVDDTETHVRDVGFEVTPEDVHRVTSKLSMLARKETVMCFGGSLPRGVTPVQLARMVARCASQGARIVLDVGDEQFEALRGHRLWMAKLSRDQLARFTQRTIETQEEFVDAARSVTTAGGGSFTHVVATTGADGAILVGERLALLGRVSVHPGRIISTAGCGESLLAGLLSVWRRGGSWNAALREGLAAATANAIGREAGAIDDDDLNEFREMTMIEDIRTT